MAIVRDCIMSDTWQKVRKLCVNPYISIVNLQKQHTNFRDAEPVVWPHSLTFEPFGVDFFDEVGVDVSCYELGLGDDVPQHCMGCCS